MGKYHPTSEILQLMKNVKQLRNVGLVGHIDHGKTTLSDSLLAEAGLLSEQLAGEARALDYLEEEQRRGITMKSANVSLYYEGLMESEQPFIINLVDTPGHLDFSGKVTRALRLIDGVVVIVDAVEEINSQSETVLRQALEEGVKPLLFINKIDRLFRELKLNDEEIRNTLSRIVNKFNQLIKRFAYDEFKEKWLVSPEDGTVIFGSALHRWGFTVPKIVSMNWSFKNISEKYENDEYSDLHVILPVWDAVLSMIIKHIQNPEDAQKYRMKYIWEGDFDSKVGKSIIKCDPDGPLVMCLSNIKYEPHGLVATGRIFSGTLTKGKKIYLVDSETKDRVLKVALFMGSRLDNADSIPAGNIAAIGGLKNIKSGETLIEEKYEDNMVSFESVKYVSEPVVTVAIEPEMLKELNNLQTYLDMILIEDPNLDYTISPETGEVLLSGMGPLHLEIAVKDIEKKGIKITTSKPMSVFRESIKEKSDNIEVESPDGLNRIKLYVERNDLDTVQYLSKMKHSAYSSFSQIIENLKQNTNLTDEEADGYLYSDEYGNIVINKMKNFEIDHYQGRKNERLKAKQKSKKKSKRNDTIYIKESTIQNMREALESIFLSGPLVSEKLSELKICIEDMKLGKIDEGNFLDLTPILRKSIFQAIKDAGSVLLEPIFQLIIQSPLDLLGNITQLLSQYQAKIAEIEQNEYSSSVLAYISVREYIPFSEEIRSKTSGRAFWQTQFYSFEPVPDNKLDTIIQELKFRKGFFF